MSGDRTELLLLLETFYRQAGYRPFRMSKFENYELYADKKDFLLSDRVITFTDTDGSLRALKPDVTLSIVQSLPDRGDQVTRVCYRENVYRPGGSDGHFREIPQGGLECIGPLGAEEIREVTELAALSLSLLSARTVLAISHLGLADGLLKAAGADESGRQRAMTLIGERNLHELSALFREKNWPESRLKDAEALLNLSCPAAELKERLSGFDWIEESTIREIGEVCRDLEAEFDFTVMSDGRYYNGFVFRGFAEETADYILSGGQYDRLMHRMGRSESAIGFAVYPDRLTPKEEEAGETVLLYDEGTDPALLRREVREALGQGRRLSLKKAEELRDLRGKREPPKQKIPSGLCNERGGEGAC